jgi:N-acyl-D-amino-acid deacylase
MHSHVDFLLTQGEKDSHARPLLEQGVTTVVAGNCGISPAPTGAAGMGAVDRLASILIEEPLDYAWDSMAGFLDRVASVRPALNVAMLVGHATLRAAHGDTKRGPLGARALGDCLRGTRRALDEGACGLSFGLGYDPGMYSSLDELRAFAAAAAACGKPITAHLKAYSVVSPCYELTYLGAHNVRALREMLAVARATGARLQLSHFIFVGRRTFRYASECLSLVDEARASGVDVMIDAFPYTCGNTTINAVLPHWFLAKIPGAYESRVLRARLQAELALAFRLVGFGFNDFQVMNPGVPGWEDLAGLRLPEIAQRWGVSSFEAMLRLSDRSRGAAAILFHGYSGDEGDTHVIDDVLARDDCLIETDAIFHCKGHPNPAAVGTFPRVLGHHVRERRAIPLEAAVRRMTGASAERFGLRDRGTLEPGRAADVTVFDRDTIGDSPPRGSAPAGRPTGIEHVFVNGEHAVRRGVAGDGVRAGAVLRV